MPSLSVLLLNQLFCLSVLQTLTSPLRLPALLHPSSSSLSHLILLSLPRPASSFFTLLNHSPCDVNSKCLVWEDSSNNGKSTLENMINLTLSHSVSPLCIFPSVFTPYFIFPTSLEQHSNFLPQFSVLINLFHTIISSLLSECWSRANLSDHVMQHMAGFLWILLSS